MARKEPVGSFPTGFFHNLKFYACLARTPEEIGGMEAPLVPNPPKKEPYVNKKQLCEHLNLPNIKALERLMKAKAIPFYKLAYKTTRFKISECEAALARRRIKDVGDKDRGKAADDKS